METVRNLLDLIEIYEQNCSGWVFSNFSFLQLSLWHLDSIRASSFVPLPKWIRDKRDCVNGQRCFKWAILAGLHPANSNSQRMSSYTTYVDKYDFSGLLYPVKLSSIAPFAVRNAISINVILL